MERQPEVTSFLSYIEAKKAQTYSWIKKRAEGVYAELWLFIISFAESSFFPLPPDVVLIAMIAFGAERWVRLATITTIASTLGGLFGYLIGVAFFDLVGVPLVEFYSLHEELVTVQNFFDDNAFWAIFVSAFTFIPYKIFTISAGLFKINLVVFVVASLLGRGLRFFIVAYVTKLYGKRVLDILMKYFNAFSVIVIALIVIYFLFA